MADSSRPASGWPARRRTSPLDVCTPAPVPVEQVGAALRIVLGMPNADHHIGIEKERSA